MLSKVMEILVRGEDGASLDRAHRADQKISAGTLDAVLPATVAEFGGGFEVRLQQWKILKRRHVRTEVLELFGLGEARKQLLPDRTDDLNQAFLDQPLQLERLWLNALAPAKGQRPDAGVDQDLHFRFRAAL